MKNSLAFCLFLSMLAPLTFGQDEHKQAITLYKQGRFQDALVLIEESIASHPDWYFPILLKGQINLKLKKYDVALRNFNDALTLEVPSKDIPKVHHYIASTHKAMGEFEKAIQGFTKLISMTPESRHFDLYFNRGQCEVQIAKSQKNKAQSYYSKAIVSFTDALKTPTRRNDLKIEASFQKAYAQYQIGNYDGSIRSLEKSIQAFEDVIRRNEKEQRAHTFVINLQFRIVEQSSGRKKIDEYNQAVRFIDRYLKSWPDDTEMLLKKGLALQGAKNYRDAIAVFEVLARQKPKDGSVFFSLGSCQMAAKQFGPAVKSLTKAISLGENKDPRVYSYTANCYIKQKSGCDGTDIPFQRNAISILEKGVSNLSGQAKAAIQKELDRTRNNLRILEDNLATDNLNHGSTIENIRAISKTIGANRATLQKNTELHIQQPTSELETAIEAGKEALAADQASLEKEYKNLEGYIKAAKKCGGSKYYKHLNDMEALLATRGG